MPMSYDTHARSETPLAVLLKERIRRDGPLRIDQYLEACLYDASHGYYVKKAVLGAAGDFITAPEISQVFGELIGLWCAATWQQMGQPAAFNFVEFGPGRGTLMRDALRAAKLVPGFYDAARVILFDTSAPLKEAQRAALSDFKGPVSWPIKLVHADQPNLPAIFIGNEFLDTEPIEQFVRGDETWSIRTVGLDANGDLQFGADLPCPGALKELEQRFPNARPGEIAELYSINHDVAYSVMHLPERMAGLFIDYGHPASAIGDTLQAIRAHKFEHPLTSPGEADITAQVDFDQVADAFRSTTTAIDGPITQAEFLGRLGIIERASKLMSSNPARAAEIETSIARLMAPGGMGSRFKVIAVRSSDVPVLPGF